MILALDTSGGELLVCLLDARLEMLTGVAEIGRRHQDRVIEVVGRVLGGRAGSARLTAVAVARGPGSQTGLRVGLACAEGLVFARRLSLIPVSSLCIAAHRAATETDVVAAVSAGRRNIFAQVFRAEGPHRVPSGPRVLCAGTDLRAALADTGDMSISGEAAVVAALEAEGQGPMALVRDGLVALTAAVREAAERGATVAYDGLAGDYGDS